MADRQPNEHQFDLAEPLPLAFANTVAWRRSEPDETLCDYPDVVAFAQAADLVGPAEAADLLARAAERPDAAATVLDRSLRLREAIYRLFSAKAAGQAPHSADLATLNQALASAVPHQRVCWSEGAYAWEWEAGPDDLDRVVWPIARAAADLLMSSELASVRECAADWCGWLFVDRSRGGRRQWCDMRVCGNRAKARRHYERARQARPPATGGGETGAQGRSA